MKTLKQFLVEKHLVEGKSQAFTFNFDGMDNADDTIKQLSELDCVSVEEKTVTVDCADEECAHSAYELLKQYSDSQRNSSHRTNNEEYAQKTKAFEKDVNALNDALVQEPEEPQDKTAEDVKDDAEEENKEEKDEKK